MVNAYGLLTRGGRGSKIPIFVLTSFENGPKGSKVSQCTQQCHSYLAALANRIDGNAAYFSPHESFP